MIGVGTAGPSRIIGEPKRVKYVAPFVPRPYEGTISLEGTVVIEVTIDKEGKVTNPKILKSMPLLDQVAIDAVLQWHYEPTLLNGVPVEVIMTVTVNFTKK